MKTDAKKRREERRAAIKAERLAARLEREEARKNRTCLFTAKVRKGDTLEIRFDFRGGEVLPFESETDPAKGLAEELEMIRFRRNKAKIDPSS